MELENDPANPCFGCGPANPHGLRLRFHREGDVVSSTLVADERLQGFPGTTHTAFLYLAMIETMNWTVWGLLGRAGVPERTGALDVRARVPTGSTVRVEGRMTGPASARAEALVDGAVVAVLERSYALPTRAEAEKRLPAAMRHPAMEGLFPE